jgi:hypothetical protein
VKELRGVQRTNNSSNGASSFQVLKDHADDTMRGEDQSGVLDAEVEAIMTKTSNGNFDDNFITTIYNA